MPCPLSLAPRKRIEQKPTTCSFFFFSSARFDRISHRLRRFIRVTRIARASVPLKPTDASCAVQLVTDCADSSAQRAAARRSHLVTELTVRPA
jgi:hypothetical protein